MNNHVVYIHRWSHPEARLILVGSGKMRKWKSKSRPYCFSKSERNEDWWEYRQKYGLPEVQIIHEGLTKSESIKIETEITLELGLDNLLNRQAGNITSEIQKVQNSKALTGVPQPQVSERQLGVPRTGETKAKIKATMKGRDLPQNKQVLICPHCGKSGTGHRIMKRWHFDNCKNKLT